MPTTIGQLANVPVPGDDVRAQYHQDLTRMGLHTFASKAALDAATWPGLANGQHAYTVAEHALWIRDNATWMRALNNTGFVTAAGRFNVTIVPGSGSQATFGFTGFVTSAPPVLQVTMESAFYWAWRIGGSNAGTGRTNLYIVNAGTGGALADNTPVTINVTAYGQALPGSIPTVGP